MTNRIKCKDNANNRKQAENLGVSWTWIKFLRSNLMTAYIWISAVIDILEFEQTAVDRKIISSQVVDLFVLKWIFCCCCFFSINVLFAFIYAFSLAICPFCMLLVHTYSLSFIFSLSLSVSFTLLCYCHFIRHSHTHSRSAWN